MREANVCTEKNLDKNRGSRKGVVILNSTIMSEDRL